MISGTNPCAWYDLSCTAVTIANGAAGQAATTTTSRRRARCGT